MGRVGEEEGGLERIGTGGSIFCGLEGLGIEDDMSATWCFGFSSGAGNHGVSGVSGTVVPVIEDSKDCILAARDRDDGALISFLTRFPLARTSRSGGTSGSIPLSRFEARVGSSFNPATDRARLTDVATFSAHTLADRARRVVSPCISLPGAVRVVLAISSLKAAIIWANVGVGVCVCVPVAEGCEGMVSIVQCICIRAFTAL